MTIRNLLRIVIKLYILFRYKKVKKMWIKIENEIFNISDLSAQSLIGKCNITIDIDIIKYPNYRTYFINMYENRKPFIISNNRFTANNCLMKSLDVVFGERITLNIICDKIDSCISEVRDGIIDDILNTD